MSSQPSPLAHLEERDDTPVTSADLRVERSTPAWRSGRLGEFLSLSRYTLVDTLKSLRRNPGLAAATAVTVALTMTLLGAAFMIRAGVAEATAQWADGVEFVVYMTPEATPDDVAAMRVTLEEAPGVKRVTYVDQAGAFTEFSNMYSSEPAVVDAVTPELLPSSFRVVPTAADERLINRIVDPIRDDPAVYEVVTADDSVRQVRDLSSALATAAGFGAIALLFVAVALSANVIRAGISARREEIEVMWLVGASRPHIAAPFVLEGVIAAGVGVAISAVTLSWAASRLDSNTASILSSFVPPDPGAVLAPLAAAALTVAFVVSTVVTVGSLRSVR